MGRSFLFAFFTLSALLFVLPELARGTSASSEPDPAGMTTVARSRLQNSDPEKSIVDPTSAEKPPSSAGRADGDGDDDERERVAEAPVESVGRKMGRHKSADKSVAGGGVIIGGLVTAISAAVYCYIRVTRRRTTENWE
ncbi:hypothetical protein OROGR_000229 [Orobanche gracilis]